MSRLPAPPCSHPSTPQRTQVAGPPAVPARPCFFPRVGAKPRHPGCPVPIHQACPFLDRSLNRGPRHLGSYPPTPENPGIRAPSHSTPSPLQERSPSMPPTDSSLAQVRPDMGGHPGVLEVPRGGSLWGLGSSQSPVRMSPSRMQPGRDGEVLGPLHDPFFLPPPSGAERLQHRPGCPGQAGQSW